MQQPLVLSDGDEPGPVEAPWAQPLLSLGRCLAHRAASTSGTQLIVGITVPARDFAAVLVAAGWVVSRPGTDLDSPIAVAAELEYGIPVRAVTDDWVLADQFLGVQPDRITIGKSSWRIEKIKHLKSVPTLPSRRFGRLATNKPGALAKATGNASARDARICASEPDIAIVGTKSWLLEELRASVRLGDAGEPDRLGDVLLPDLGNSPAWLTRVYAAQTMQELDLPDDLCAVILDGASAVRWLSEVLAPTVVAIIDRSAADETAHEMIKQSLGHGTRIAVDTLDWVPPRGAEAIAFEVPL